MELDNKSMDDRAVPIKSRKSRKSVRELKSRVMKTRKDKKKGLEEQTEKIKRVTESKGKVFPVEGEAGGLSVENKPDSTDTQVSNDLSNKGVQTFDAPTKIQEKLDVQLPVRKRKVVRKKLEPKAVSGNIEAEAFSEQKVEIGGTDNQMDLEPQVIENKINMDFIDLNDKYNSLLNKFEAFKSQSDKGSVIQEQETKQMFDIKVAPNVDYAREDKEVRIDKHQSKVSVFQNMFNAPIVNPDDSYNTNLHPQSSNKRGFSIF
jgi:hypothetical protein